MLHMYQFFIQAVYRCAINQAVCESLCPMRLSKAVLADWVADLRMGRSEIILNKCQVAMPFLPMTTFPSSLAWVSTWDTYRKNWPMLPGSISCRDVDFGSPQQRNVFLKLDTHLNPLIFLLQLAPLLTHNTGQDMSQSGRRTLCLILPPPGLLKRPVPRGFATRRAHAALPKCGLLRSRPIS